MPPVSGDFTNKELRCRMATLSQDQGQKIVIRLDRASPKGDEVQALTSGLLYKSLY